MASHLDRRRQGLRRYYTGLAIMRGLTFETAEAYADVRLTLEDAIDGRALSLAEALAIGGGAPGTWATIVDCSMPIAEIRALAARISGPPPPGTRYHPVDLLQWAGRG